MKENLKLRKELRHLGKVASDGRYTGRELERARHNIAAVGERLKRHDYRIASYSDNKFNVPERIRDFFAELEFHSTLGRLWQKVFKGVGIKKDMKILDLCPGAFPKVELGLFYSSFRGQVSILDCCEDALKEAEKFLALFNPEFSVKTVVSDAFKYKGPRYDLVVANHMLDDILLGWVSKEMGVELGDIYAQETTLLAAWGRILESEEYWKKKVVQKVSKMLFGMTAGKGRIILTQYPSYMERTLQLKEVSEFMQELLKGVAESLIQAGCTDISRSSLRFIETGGWPFGAEHCRVLLRAGGKSSPNRY